MKNNFLLDLLTEQYGKEELTKILDGYTKKRYTTFRINILKTKCEEVLNEFEQNNISVLNVPWYRYAYIVLDKNEEEIRNLKCYQNGHIYLQSLSSMLPVLILNPREKEDILDMCAAPGSKTSQIAMETNNKAYITAIEKNKIRQDRLKYNLEKQSVTCCNILNVDARNLDNLFSFDKILLDAPCSGSGTIKIISMNDEIFTNERLNKIRDTQVSLLKKALQVLKPHEKMVYSTCSILSLENEKVLEEVKKEIDFNIIQVNVDKSIPLLPVSISGTICICPNEYFEGFFIALIEKK